jgi:outer membrane lipase/esterase
MFRHVLRCAALLAALIGQAQTQVGADDFDRVVSFGDSLSDNGNLNAALSFEVLKFVGVLDDIDYAQGRFSNGPTFVELIAGNANFAAGESSQARFYGVLFSPANSLLNPNVNIDGNVNLAIGGATTTGGDIFLGLGIPSVEDQINDFRDAGGQFGTNDLVTLLAGANDIFNANLDAGAAAAAAAAQSRNVTALLNAQARTILIANLPNLGATPRFNGDVTTVEAGLVATNTFNGILAADLQGLAAANPQANLIQADLQGMLDIVIANPEAFGFTNVTEACASAGGGVCANPDEFLFFDEVHPTAAGHFFLAQFVDALLSTDDQAAMTGPLGELTVSARLEASDILFRQAVPLLASGGAGGAYAEIVGQLGSGSGDGGGSDFDYQLAGIRVGFDARRDAFILGAAFAYLEGDISGRNLTADTSTAQVDAYVLYQFAPFFAGLEGGVSFANFDDVRRDTGIPTLIAESETDSVSYTVAATLGTQIDAGGIRLTPAVRAGYLSANVDAFSESVPLLALSISDREIEAGFWTARLRASAYIGETWRPQIFVEAGYEDLFSVEDGYSAQLIDNTAQAVESTPSAIEARGFFLKAGASAEIGGGAHLAAEYGISFQESGDDVHSGRISLKFPLGGGEESLQ